MAYIDQDRSREKTISGAVSLAVIGLVGYGLVSGLAMTVMRDKHIEIVGQIWKATPPPKPTEDPTPQKHRTNRPAQTLPDHRDPIVLPVPDPFPTAPDPLPFPTMPFPATGLGGDDGPPAQPPATDHTARATPRGDPGSWVTPDDYTPAAVRAGIEGRTAFRLDIGADGRPARCTVLSSSGSDDLDKTACRKLMSRARFKPALDAGGNPVASTYSGGVTWKLPAE